jgi:hypothetical protein
VGYGFGILAGLAGLFLINVWPGWERVSFLTADTTKVLWLVNGALVAGIVADLVYARYDPPWLVALGGLVTTGIGLAGLIRIAQVFPVDFSGWEFDGTGLVRVLLILAIVGTAIGVVVQLVALVRGIMADGVRR